MKRLGALLVAGVVLFSACSKTDYAQILRKRLTGSGNLTRSFKYIAVAKDQAYSIRGRVEDDLRYTMVLSRLGKPLIDYVVRDDSLSVRLRDAAFGMRLANTLGDPVVDGALKDGRWVTDPAGAPPLIRTDTGGSKESSGDPFQDARDALDFSIEAMGSARDVRLFNLDDIEYRSQLDPWEYPDEANGEDRYDLRRPFLPTSASGENQRGAQGSVGPAQFRKMSVFVEKGRVDKICSVIDIEGHEEFIALRQRGLKSNPFLRDLLEQIEKGTTPIPIEPRYTVADIAYPPNVSVDVPGDAVVGRLEAFQTALKQGITAGALKPPPGVDTSECKRKNAPTER